jgi:hypothetical protein
MNKIRHQYDNVYKIEGWFYDSTLLLHFHYHNEIGTLSLHYPNYTKVQGSYNDMRKLQELIKQYYIENPNKSCRYHIEGII